MAKRRLTRPALPLVWSIVFESHKVYIDPFRAPKFLPILTSNKFVKKEGFQL